MALEWMLTISQNGMSHLQMEAPLSAQLEVLRELRKSDVTWLHVLFMVARSAS